jgi:membrane protein implicated in regulation of membrane protease activity
MSPARMLMLTGGLLLVAGLVLWLLERGGAGGHAWSWIGRLPGDIRVERPNFHFYFPLTTCLLASVVLTVLFWLVRRGRP